MTEGTRGANDAARNTRVDQATGTEYVGHEWDGIEELDTPMPRWWLWTFYATIAWGVVYLVLYPAWPLVNGATEGVLGWTSRGQLAEEMRLADQERTAVRDQIAAIGLQDLPGNPELMQGAVAGGAAAFKVNCVQCHGAGAAGSPGYPNLNDDDWIWGGDLGAIEYTIIHGVRWDGSDQTRFSLMPGFGDIFSDQEINGLASHVMTFTGRGQSNTAAAELYDINCASCHQSDGSGDRVQGAPPLNDAIWLYGDSESAIRNQIRKPSHGVMPGWKDRLDPVTIKMLAAYVHSRGGGEVVAQPAGEPSENSPAQDDE